MTAPTPGAGAATRGPASASSTASPEVVVWDPVVRIFHWTVVAGCLLNLFVVEDGEALHQIIGYVVAAVLVVRVIWGFIGTHYARFAQFVPGPRRLGRYLSALAKGREPRMLGHNPAGAVMMLALMALLAATCVSGWMMGLDAFWGEDWLEETHEWLANSILVLALLHALAALVESHRHRENLVLSMITGRKRRA
ncbi:cytochrome b/b6 domain-containing protein [Ancylobacter sp. WKF20]|jgi:cytochrome b|uniref:cytochrome b/b6 domain-containing protein n=1 Tax=Ancylobacter sp. WKF20 TaxID=3039801 RepID=UPI0024343A08|nr:cytochrome b/b6 domain-containing protein [Ancylobacter sp. WKF20]WGD29087.1 cytochrome b/b6 domain-containing protein [Ancylobacter sp. WKF20]